MKTIELVTATRPLPEYVAELGNDVLILMSQGQPVAAIVPLHDGDDESLSLSLNPKFAKIIAEARDEIRTGKTYRHEEIRREFDEE